MPRSLRIPEDVWRAAVDKARVEGTTVTAVVVKALDRYLGSPAETTITVKREDVERANRLLSQHGI